MPARQTFFKGFFLAFLFYQTYMIAMYPQTKDVVYYEIPFVTAIVEDYLGKADRIFYFVNFVGVVGALFGAFSGKLKRECKENNSLIQIMIAYSLYNFLIILPLSYTLKLETPQALITYSFLNSMIILVPFFLWYVLPAFKKTKDLFYWVDIGVVFMLIFAIRNFLTGNMYVMRSGHVRLLTAVAAMPFAMVLVNHFFKNKRNVLDLALIAGSLLGIILINFRSAIYFTAVIIVLGSFMLFRKNFTKKKVTASILILFSIVFALAQNRMFRENFLSRVEERSLTDPSMLKRYEGWELALESFSDHPIMGSMQRYGYYRTVFRDETQPHGFVFEILPTEGIIGLVFYLYVLWTLLRISLKNRDDTLSAKMFLIMLFYVLFSSLNVTLLNRLNFLIFVLTSAIILQRNNVLEAKRAEKEKRATLASDIRT